MRGGEKMTGVEEVGREVEDGTVSFSLLRVGPVGFSGDFGCQTRRRVCRHGRGFLGSLSRMAAIHLVGRFRLHLKKRRFDFPKRRWLMSSQLPNYYL